MSAPQEPVTVTQPLCTSQYPYSSADTLVVWASGNTSLFVQPGVPLLLPCAPGMEAVEPTLFSCTAVRHTARGWAWPRTLPTPLCAPLQKWQRRFFILYEHGLLRYALDEMVSVPLRCSPSPPSAVLSLWLRPHRL